MAIDVRRANLDVDEALIIDFLARNHIPDSNRKRFDWLYRNGPAGHARAWIAHDIQTLATAGIAAAFPRRIQANRGHESAWVLGDFVIDPHYRSLGPAMQLQRACLKDLDSGVGSIYYDFPSAIMTAVYRRLGIAPQHRLVRFAKLLRADNQIHQRIKQPQVARVLSSVVNAALAVGQSMTRRRLPNGFVISLHQGPFGDEFTRLAEQIGPSLGVCLQRSAEYLNWRYNKHPYRSFEIMVAQRVGSLLGYAVVSQEDTHLSLVDLFGEASVVSELVRAVILIAAERKLQTVTAAAVDPHLWTEIFRELGFRRRDDCPVMASLPKREAEAADVKVTGWFLMNGDRES